MKNVSLIIILLVLSLAGFSQDIKIIGAKVSNLHLKEKNKLDEIFSNYTAVTVEDNYFDGIHESEGGEISFNIPNINLPLKPFKFIKSEILDEKIIPKNFKAKITLLKASGLSKGELFTVTLINKSISGVYYSKTGEEWIFAPISNILGKEFESSKTTIFYKKDYFKNKSTKDCATSNALKQLKLAGNIFSTNNYCRKLYVAIEGDIEWFNFHGSFVGGIGAMASIMNNVSGIYSSQLNIFIEISNISLWQSPLPPYPYSRTTPIDPDTALDNFRDHWNDKNGDIFRNCAILFSKRQFTGGFVGYAYEGGICGGSSYGMIANPQHEIQATAHEIGHILGHYGHDAGGTIMESSTTGVSSFSQYSIDQIQNNMASGGDNGCIEHGNINMYYDNNYISPYSQSFMCLYNWYNFYAPGNHNISWEVQNSSANAYVVYTSGNNSAVISSGNTEGYFSLKASKSNGCGYVDRYYDFYTAPCYSYRVYPNPATDLIGIEFEKFENIADLPNNIELFSENSTIAIKSAKPKDYLKPQQNGNRIEFDVKNLKRGTYFLHITDEKRKEKLKDIIRIILE